MEQYIEQIENSNLPTETVEAACEALAFVQGLHDTFSDWQMISNKEVDVDVLEKAFDSFIAEISAASIFCASFKDLTSKLRSAADRCEQDGVHSLLVKGYRKFADRVDKTQENLLK